MKKLFIFGLLAFLGFAPHVFAQGFTALAPIPGLTSPEVTSVINSTSLANFFNNLYKYCIGLAATLAVIQIIWSGLDIAIFHKDAVSAIMDSKDKIYNAIYGLILVLSPVLVFSIINPSILNLSLNLPPINLTTPPAPSNTVALPGGGTLYTDGNGTSAATGSWCFGAITSTDTGNSGTVPTTYSCFPDSKGCLDNLTAIKSGSTAWTVQNSFCVQKVN